MDIKDLYNPHAEAGVIASLIQNPNLYYYAENLTSNHFFDPQNSYLYYAISELVKKDIHKIDSYNIFMILNTKKIEIPMTNEALCDLIAFSPAVSRDTAEEYLMLVNGVLDYSFRRETLKELDNCKHLVFNLGEKDVQAKIYNKIEDIICSYSESDLVLPMSELADEIWERISSEEKANDFIDWKFPSLNEFCKLSRTDLIIISALQKRGKSLFLMNCLVDLLKKDKKVIYLDSELDTDLFFMRLLAHLCKIDFVRIRDRRYEDGDLKKVNEALEWIKSKCFIHEYVPVLTEESVLSLTKKAKHKHGTDVLILDYLKGNSSYALDAFKNSAYLGRMTDLCKNVIGGREKMFVLAAVQAASDQQESVADSKKIMRNCSALLHLARKTPDEIQNDGGIAFGNMKLTCEANRNGRLHNDGEYLSLFLDGDKCTFEESKQPERKMPY